MSIMITQPLIDESRQEILDGIKHLEYSYNKVLKLSADMSTLSSEDLETWEGLISRFGRVADIYLSKYLRAKILFADPAFRGTFRDHLNQAEKMSLISSAEKWMEIRELRNTSVHEYSKSKIPKIFESVRVNTPLLIQLKNQLK
jgi:hypothetical protein